MSESKHTPGPWAWDEKGALRGSNGERVGDLDNGEPITPERARRIMGDRSLQVAAPEMLETLDRALRSIGMVGATDLASDDPIFAVMGEIETLIARARGEG